MKVSWSKEEISIADELMSLVPKLRDEFLKYHTDFDTTFNGGTPYSVANPSAILDNVPGKVDWKVEGIRYALFERNIVTNLFMDPKIRNNFPTATGLTEKYINCCGCSGFSILESIGIISRHLDVENRLHKTVRIHIPLIVPEGDCGLEVNGTSLKWSDLFAFDNGELHSAYNRTKKRRLIYIIDIQRSFLSIPNYDNTIK
jgi:hypothetical protein